MPKCEHCGKGFLTYNQLDGHKAQCPEKDDRTIPKGYQGSTVGRFRIPKEETDS